MQNIFPESDYRCRLIVSKIPPGPAGSFRDLEEAFDFMSECFESDDYNRFYEAIIDRKEKYSPGIERVKEYFFMLKGVHMNKSLREIYSDREFPLDDGEFKLGGHMSELGFLHINFRKKGDYWYLASVYTCRSSLRE